MSRRDFLKVCGSAGLGFAAPINWHLLANARANAPEAEGHAGPYYVVFNASGGWDTTYLMDPKGVEGINRLYKQGDIVTQGKLKYAPIKKHMAAGMSNEEFFGEFGKELLV